MVIAQYAKQLKTSLANVKLSAGLFFSFTLTGCEQIEKNQ